MKSNHRDRYGGGRTLSRRGVLKTGRVGARWFDAAGSAAGGKREWRASCSRQVLHPLLYGGRGPAHQDLWDMKPDAPLEYRGEFKPIPSSAPDIQVCEHLPLLARQMHRVALVRSVRHEVNDHNAGAYYALTGRSPVEGSRLIVQPGPNLFPTFGSVLAKLRPSDKPLPDFVHIPEIISNNKVEKFRASFAGFLGAGLNPYVTGDPSLPGYTMPKFSLRNEVTTRRFERRQKLRRDLVDRLLGELGSHEPVVQMERHYQRAFELLGSSAAREAFGLTREKEALRERYGFRP